MVADKNVAQSLEEIAHLADYIIFTRSLTLNAGRKTASMIEFKNIIKITNKSENRLFLDPCMLLNLVNTN